MKARLRGLRGILSAFRWRSACCSDFFGLLLRATGNGSSIAVSSPERRCGVRRHAVASDALNPWSVRFILAGMRKHSP
jgi:hypothetical protein